MRTGAGFGQLEVLRSLVVDGRPVLVFTCPFTADPTLFAAPVVTRRDGSTVIFGFHHDGADGSLWIGDPMAVTLDAEGYLVPAAG